MDRATIQYGQLSLETDLLRAQQYAMVGIGKLFEAVVGTSIAVDGFGTAPTAPASMSVNIAPGQVYQQTNLEGSPWSSLPADLTHNIVKQGIQLNTTTQTFVAPTTVGFAQNFLIQVAYSDADSGLVVRPYYNAANPSVPFNGPGNAGTQDSSVRAGVAALAVKAGVAATSGTQTTPTPDAGYAGLYVVTVAYGQTTITAGNISLYPGAPFIAKLGSGSSGRSLASARVTTAPNSSVITILGSTNVSSITMGPTYNGGLITLAVVFATPMSNNRYTPIISAGAEVGNGGPPSSSEAHVQPGTLTANGFTIYMAGNSTGIYQDWQSDLGFAVFANP
jgi:hypothetical protein